MCKSFKLKRTSTWDVQESHRTRLSNKRRHRNSVMNSFTSEPRFKHTVSGKGMQNDCKVGVEKIQ